MQAKKKLGQHWLKNLSSLKAVADAAELSKDDTVLEIGPGHGTLTATLLARAKKVVAVELDQELAKALQQKDFNRMHLDAAQGSNEERTSRRRTTVNERQRPADAAMRQEPAGVAGSASHQGGALQVIEGDILEFDLRKLPKGYKVAANIPYYLTSHLLRNLLESNNPPSVISLLVQKEVAQRLAAKPGQMSVLAFSAQYYGEVNLAQIVPKEFFDPVPKVDSQIIQIKVREKPLFEADVKKLFRVVKAGFGERRKRLANSLSGGLQMSKDEARELVESAGLDANTRAQELSMSDWQRLYGLLGERL